MEALARRAPRPLLPGREAPAWSPPGLVLRAPGNGGSAISSVRCYLFVLGLSSKLAVGAASPLRTIHGCVFCRLYKTLG